MAEKNSYYEALVHKLFEGTITPEEREELENWYRETPDSSVIISSSLAKDEDELRRLLLQKTKEKAGIDETKTGNRRGFVRVAAAVIFVLMGTAGYFWIKNNTTTPFDDDNKIVTSVGEDEILPGGNKAILTLSDGRKIVLDNANNGQLADEGNVKIIKLDDGQLSYDKGGDAKELLYNTISTPAGGKYQIVLSDGTIVWLNAKSSLRFPLTFKGGERKVELKGEGYFEVKHDESAPFFVSTDNLKVKVLGTKFDIRAYNDGEADRATLVQGSVEVSGGSQTVRLKPNQQAGFYKGEDKLKVNRNVSVENVLAWKNGYFKFDNDRLETILREVARWYDADIVYEGKVDDLFSGSMPRSEDIRTLLNILEYTDKVEFKIIGKQIIVNAK